MNCMIALKKSWRWLYKSKDCPYSVKWVGILELLSNICMAKSIFHTIHTKTMLYWYYEITIRVKRFQMKPHGSFLMH